MEPFTYNDTEFAWERLSWVYEAAPAVYIIDCPNILRPQYYDCKDNFFQRRDNNDSCNVLFIY